MTYFTLKNTKCFEVYCYGNLIYSNSFGDQKKKKTETFLTFSAICKEDILSHTGLEQQE